MRNEVEMFESSWIIYRSELNDWRFLKHGATHTTFNLSVYLKCIVTKHLAAWRYTEPRLVDSVWRVFEMWSWAAALLYMQHVRPLLYVFMNHPISFFRHWQGFLNNALACSHKFLTEIFAAAVSPTKLV